MDLIANLATGFAVSLTPANLGFCFMGALIGTLVGVLPGIAPITTIAILLPFTFSLPPSSSLIMLAGIFYGAQYGGSTTAILVNVPGESSSIVTCLDGHQMAKQGRAGPALAIAAIASFVAGTIATIVMATASAPMTWLALKFNAAEYFSLMVLGLTGSVVLAHGAPEKAVAMVLVGLLLGLVGIDVNSGSPRMTMDLMDLGDGVGFVPIAIGMFGIAELAVTLGKPQDRGLLTVKLRDLWPSWVEIRQCIPAMLRVPFRLLFPAIVLFCCIGTYTANNTVFDIWVMLVFSGLGVFFYKVGAEPAPFVLGFVLGPLMEENFRRAMYISRGSPVTFIERPISAILLLLTVALFVVLVLPAIRAKREEVFKE